ncbi:MAG: hypothetical protein WC924_00100 [Candidatus Gracilibacteria bacterium]
MAEGNANAVRGVVAAARMDLIEMDQVRGILARRLQAAIQNFAPKTALERGALAYWEAAIKDFDEGREATVVFIKRPTDSEVDTAGKGVLEKVVVPFSVEA